MRGFLFEVRGLGAIAISYKIPLDKKIVLVYDYFREPKRGRKPGGVHEKR